MTILLQLWSVSLFVLWATTKLTLKRNDIGASSEGWKGLLELTDNIKEQIESAGITWEDLTDKELHREIQHLLTGGPVPTSSGNPFPQGHSSLWKWIRRVKWHLLKVMFFLVCICLENLLRPIGVFDYLSMGGSSSLISEAQLCMAVFFYTTASMIIACTLGSTYRQRLLILLAALVLCVPFFFYHFIERDMVLPGLCVGSFLAFFLGSSRGSRAVLFVAPLLCNYIVVFGFFISLVINPPPYYHHM